MNLFLGLLSLGLQRKDIFPFFCSNSKKPLVIVGDGVRKDNSINELINFIQKLNYNFYDDNLKKIRDIFTIIDKMKDGSSKNFFLI